MIVAQNLTYKYSDGTVAINNANLEIGKGVTVIIGPNGSGKTTLLKLLSLIYKPTKGTVLVEGKDYWRLSRDDALVIRRKIVFVQEKPVLLRGSIEENITYGLRIRGIEPSEAREKALKTLEILGAKNIWGKKPATLSAGETQIISLARALVLEPKYLFLDEPTANLDLERRMQVMQFLRKLGERGVAVTVATHDLSLVYQLAARTIILNEGKIVREGMPREVLGDAAAGI